MREQTAAFVLHIAVGLAAVLVAFWSVPVEARSIFLFVVGVPWVAGFFAFYGLPRTALAWTFPVITLLVGLVLWWLVVGLSNLGS